MELGKDFKYIKTLQNVYILLICACIMRVQFESLKQAQFHNSAARNLPHAWIVWVTQM